MARPQVADEGDGLQIGRVAANILNKQSRTADKGWSSSLEVGRGAKYLCIRGGPQKPAPALRPSNIYSASPFY
jgi:hypothetical protein